MARVLTKRAKKTKIAKDHKIFRIWTGGREYARWPGGGSMLETTVVVIGGGATGMGALRDLAMRGVPVILLEQVGL